MFYIKLIFGQIRMQGQSGITECYLRFSEQSPILVRFLHYASRCLWRSVVISGSIASQHSDRFDLVTLATMRILLLTLNESQCLGHSEEVCDSWPGLALSCLCVSAGQPGLVLTRWCFTDFFVCGDGDDVNSQLLRPQFSSSVLH